MLKQVLVPTLKITTTANVKIEQLFDYTIMNYFELKANAELEGIAISQFEDLIFYAKQTGLIRELVDTNGYMYELMRPAYAYVRMAA